MYSGTLWEQWAFIARRVEHPTATIHVESRQLRHCFTQSVRIDFALFHAINVSHCLHLGTICYHCIITQPGVWTIPLEWLMAFVSYLILQWDLVYTVYYTNRSQWCYSFCSYFFVSQFAIDYC